MRKKLPESCPKLDNRLQVLREWIHGNPKMERRGGGDRGFLLRRAPVLALEMLVVR